MIKAVIFDFFGVLEAGGESNKPLFEFIRELKRAGLCLGIISNANEDWIRGILTPEETNLFDDIILSFQVGLAKPDHAIYKLSAQNLGVGLDEAVFVDDILGFCEAAEELGMKSVCYRDFDQTKADLDKLLDGASADN